MSLPFHATALARLILTVLLFSVTLTCVAIADDGEETRALHFATGSGLNFYAGDVVTVTNSSVDDLFAAGGIVNLFGVSAPSLIVAGGSVSLSDILVEDVIAAGGDVDISGMVTDDLIVAGGRVTLRNGSEIGEDAIVSGGQLILNGTISGDLVANGGAAVIGSRIGGDVTVNAASITILSGTRIDGDFTYSSREELDLPADVVITGTLSRKVWQDHGFGLDESVGIGRMIAMGLALWFAIVVALAIFASVVATVFPQSMDKFSARVRANVFQNLGIGFAAMISFPAISAILMATLIGIPLGLFVLGCYALMVASSFVIACMGLGLEIRRLTKQSGTPITTRGRLGWAFAGVFTFALIGLVPFLGNVAQALAVMVALGAILKTAWADRNAESV
ncbi:MAG: polymer-forming cytoskeletal protein [Rhodospirillaceae bacterium]